MYKRQKNNMKVNKKVLIATVDVGKSSHYGYWVIEKGVDCRPFEFSANREGFETFWRIIEKAKEQHKCDEIMVGLESTGPYGEPLIHFLRAKPAELVQVNPFHTKRVKELIDNSPQKTDQKDPRVIANIILLGNHLSLIVPTGPAAELRRLGNARDSAVCDRTSTLNRLQSLVSVIFPEFLEIMNGVQSKTAHQLLNSYTFPSEIVRLGRGCLRNMIYKTSRGKLGNDRADELLAAAKNSVGVTEGMESIRMEIQHLLSKIAAEEKYIQCLEKEMAKYLKLIPYSRFLLSIKGVCIVTAAVIIGEVADFKSFQHAEQLIKLAGLNLYEISSGIHKGSRRITKRGRPLLRKILYFAALNAGKKGGILHSEYQRYISGDKPKMKAVVAIMRKLLKIMFALVRDNTEYQTEYSIKKAA